MAQIKFDYSDIRKLSKKIFQDFMEEVYDHYYDDYEDVVKLAYKRRAAKKMEDIVCTVIDDYTFEKEGVAVTSYVNGIVIKKHEKNAAYRYTCHINIITTLESKKHCFLSKTYYNDSFDQLAELLNSLSEDLGWSIQEAILDYNEMEEKSHISREKVKKTTTKKTKKTK